MKITMGKAVKNQMLIMSVFLLIAIIMISVRGKSIYFGLLTLAVLVPFLLPWYISSGRTFLFSREGITIQWLWLKKHYDWDELQHKQYVRYSGIKGSALRSPCVSVAEFYKKRVFISKIDAHTYSWRHHPFAFVFVSFPPSKSWRINISKLEQERNPIIYEANEEEFRAKLLEWGVEMEETARGSYASC